MKIIVGSTNPSKIDAVREVVSQYACLGGAIVFGIEVHSGVSDQPKTIDEVVRGATNRALKAYNHTKCDYGIGLESGLNNFTIIGYMDLTACTIYNGKDFHYGLSSAFKLPKEVTNAAIDGGLNLNQACYQLGLSDNPEIGKSEGIIGILTKGRKTRKDYTKDAIIMAMIHVENKFQPRRT